ncbi:hypothetical protein [Rosistilla oblonga]|uniref:hypothetical protein n=1 Tax=Rosistilla oblonga TaxID=2527990 RepID=UPI003A972370
MTQPRTLRLPPRAACNVTFVVAILLAGTASAQGWPFNDAPEPVGFGILQTANQAAVGQPDHGGSGVIMSAEALELGPGEEVIGGDPILRQSGIIRQPAGGGFSGGNHRPLNQSGHGGGRRSRSRTHFGPNDSYDCAWGCPEGCAPAFYGSFDALYFTQGDMDVANYSLNPGFGFVGDDYQPGVRFTVGRMFNCSDGFEVTYTGLLEWEYSGGDTYGVGIPSVNVTEQQSLTARFNSVEINHRQWGWDVISTVSGFRVIQYQERFDFSSSDISGDSNRTQYRNYYHDIDNTLVGAQLGLDLMYPVMKRLMVGSRIRGGLYADFIDTDFGGRDGTAPYFTSSRDHTKLSGLIEYGVSADYHFTNFLSAKIGYEFWYLMNVSTVAANQSAAFVSGETDEVGFHGATASVEVLF